MLSLAPPPTAALPARRPDLVIRPLGEAGPCVVKDPRTGAFFQLGAEEHFLLTQLDGRQDAGAICAAFEQQFGGPLSEEELHEFVGMAEAQGFLQKAGEDSRPPEIGPRPAPAMDAPRPAEKRQGLLYWRKSLFDPDRLFTWLEPHLRFFWTPGFLFLSAACIVTAAGLAWLHRGQLAGSALNALRWETAGLVWTTVFVVTLLHEFAHGLTCKRYGGEVHEVGFLLLFFLPCFYCNVSDAWLFKEKSKRLWVMFAGGYFELFLWALAVFAWRLTLPGSVFNHVAFVVVASCGVQTLFNFNPLLKLDGYYLLSDWLEIPNLHERAHRYFKARLRRLLWGAPRPDAEPRGRALLAFGAVSWLYSAVFLTLMLAGLFQFLWRGWGWLGLAGVGVLGFVSTRGLFRGLTGGEVCKMIATRFVRTMLWGLGLAGVAGVLGLVEIEDWAGAPFRVRPARRAELRAPVAGFLKEVYCDEGDRVAVGALVARIEVPNLESRLARKQAEVREARARLRLLEVGARPEEMAEQRQRVERLVKWRDRAQQDLARTRKALAGDLERLEKQVAARSAERGVAEAGYLRMRGLFTRKAATQEQYQEAEGAYRISQARLAEAEAAKRALEAKGVLEAETELARREKELADARAALRLLEAGSRPEEIEALRASLERLQEEVSHLEEQRRKQTVAVPLAGQVTTARLGEKLGQFFREGELICVVEEPAEMEAELALNEQDVARVQAGQPVKLKARALPFDTLAATVDRVAPAGGTGEAQGQVIAHCRLEGAPVELRPEMTGHARVYTGRRPVGLILLDRALRFVRTEFWW